MAETVKGSQTVSKVALRTAFSRPLFLLNDVDPQKATRLEMFALLSYMDDKGLTDNHGISSYSKMKAYSNQAEYNGFVNGLEDENLLWSEKRDWISILNNAKETFLNIPETYRQALNIDKMVFSLLENIKETKKMNLL